MLILAIIAGGAFVGWLANLLLGGSWQPSDWGELLVAGIVGSFVGGTLLSFLFGDGFALRASGIVGSIIGAVLVLLAWRAWRGRSATA